MASKVACLVLIGALFASPVAAQLGDDPIQISPRSAAGLTIATDLGHGINGASGRATSFNATLVYGLPSLQVAAGVGVVHSGSSDPDIVHPSIAGGRPAASERPINTTSPPNFMVQAALTLVPATPAVPLDVALFGGVGLAAGGVTTAPLGLVFGVEVPTRGISMEPWVAPRFSYFPGVDGRSSTFYGVSGGLNVDRRAGVGFQTAVDYMPVSGASPVLVSFGVHYRFKRGVGGQGSPSSSAPG